MYDDPSIGAQCNNNCNRDRLYARSAILSSPIEHEELLICIRSLGFVFYVLRQYNHEKNCISLTILCQIMPATSTPEASSP